MLQEFELQSAWGFLSELAVGDLDTFPGTPRIVGWVDGLDSDNNRVVVFLRSGQIIISVKGGIYHADTLRELLLQP